MSNKGPRTKQKDRAHHFWHYCETCQIYTPFVQGEHEGHETVFIDKEFSERRDRIRADIERGGRKTDGLKLP